MDEKKAAAVTPARTPKTKLMEQ
eukprot:SAG11_NODE_27534_length_331_cov_1.504310_1_plen_22_part_10